MRSTLFKTGFVLGKFCPLHLGHEHLINAAFDASEKVYVVVDNIMDEVIPVRLRMEWVKERFPQAIVLTQPFSLPQNPDETQDFWQIWRSVLLQLLPEHIDAVFASETYGARLAHELGAEFVPVDIDRIHVPVSATNIRSDFSAYWDYISPAAQSWFKRRICVFGPESTGKSTLVAQLAQYYGAAKVNEYALDVIAAKLGSIDFADMRLIVEGHHRRFCEALSLPYPYLFVDTDAISSKIWAKVLFDKDLPFIEQYISSQVFDLYLLLDIDLPWKDDIHRYCPDNRGEFFEMCRNELEYYHRQYVIVSGTGDARLQNAIEAIENFPFKRSFS